MPSETPDNLECIEAANRIIAEYFAPNIYHMTDAPSNRSVGGRADLLTSVFYDVDLNNVTSQEDLSTGNNWTSLENYSSGETEDIDALDPYVYYSVVWAENYWVIAYGFYHPRDWAGGGFCCNGPLGSDSHENDYEGAMFVVDRNTYTLKGAVTIFHGPLKKYSTTTDDLTNNPNVFIDDRTHAVEMNLEEGECIKVATNPCDGCKGFDLGDSENHIFYTPVQNSEEAYVKTTPLTTIRTDSDGNPYLESRLYGEGKYILEDVFGSHEYSLSNQRNNPFVFTGSTGGSFYAASDENCLGGTASAPWGWGNFMHTRENIVQAICFAETGYNNCYSSDIFPALELLQSNISIEYNPYFPTLCGENVLTTTSGGSFNVSNDFTWNYPEDYIISKDVIVRNGATLTINNRTLLFAEGIGIIVQDGGRLIANNATFGVCPAVIGEAKWRGISALHNPGPNANEVTLNNSMIRNATIGLSLGQGLATAPIANVAYTFFIDNDTGIDYAYKDQISRIGGCVFRGNNIGVSSRFGEYGSGDLEIVSCLFEDNDIAIISFDSPINVSHDNMFDGGRIGILTGETNSVTSNVIIGSPDSGDQNIFRNLDKGIFMMSGGGPSGLSILNNTFENIQENAVQIHGESEFTIANNRFDSNRRGIEVVGSGSAFNRIQCNIFDENEAVDNLLANVNSNTRFLENDYNSPDVAAKNIAWFATLPDMGSAALSASNCFNDAAGITPDVASINSNNFTYFYKNTNECQEQEPNGLSNVLKEDAIEVQNVCGGEIGPFNFIDPGNGNGGQVDINNFDADFVCKSCVLDSIGYYKNQIVANGGNNPETGSASLDTPTSSLVKKEQIFEQWVNFGLFVASKQKNYDFAETILSPLNEWKWKTKYYGLSLEKKNLSEAANRLAALPNTNSNQAAFKSTQEINLKYITAKTLGTESEITVEDIETLKDIGLSHEPSNGYARTLLFILKGIELPTLIPELEEYIESETQAKEKENNRGLNISADGTIRIFPNPARDHIQVRSESEVITRIIFTDIYGKSTTVKKGNYKSTIIETAGISGGIYLVQLQLENGKLITRKIVIEN